MSDRKLGPLAPDLAAAFEAERGRATVSLAAEEALRRRIEASVLAESMSLVSSGAGFKKLLLVFVAGGVVGTGVGAVIHAKLTEPSPAVELERAPVPRAEPVKVTEPDAGVLPKREVVRRSPRVETRPELTEPTPVAARDEALARERTLVDMARSAVARGRYAQALEALFTHEALFPKGELVEERELLMVQSLVSSGRVPQARARAAAFKEQHPRSLFLETIEELVAGKEGSAGSNDGKVPSPQ